MKPAGIVAFLYFCFSTAWIYFSDLILFSIWSNDVKRIQKFQNYKGFLFVLLTTILIFFLLRKYLKRLIEKQTEIDSEKKLYQKLFESISIPVFVMRNSDLRFLQVNTAAEKIYGYSKEEFSGLTLNAISYDHFGFINKIRLEGPELQELTARQITKYGKFLNVFLYISQIEYFGSKCLLASVIDITDQIDTETAITNAIINTTEKERAAFANEIHDNLTQILSIASSNLKNLCHDHPVVREQEKYSNALKFIEEAINVSRSIAHGIMPQALDEIGLIDSLKELIAEFQSTYAIHISFNYDDEICIKDRTYILNFYRIVQEAVNNIIKHANATVIEIDLRIKDELIYLNIIDNGTGFDYKDKWKFGDGIGLRIMRNRAVQLNGIFKINSEKSGTKISLEVPIKN